MSNKDSVILPQGQSAWYVYMVQASDGKLYSGVTTEPLRRFRQHCGELAGGAKFFRGRPAQRLEYLVRVANRSEAQKCEVALKKLSRLEKLRLIERSDVSLRNQIRFEYQALHQGA